MNKASSLILAVLLLAPPSALHAADAPKPVKPSEERQTHYQPTRESLSQHRVPEWYQDAKIGFFYHWGPQSVVGDKFDKDALLFCRAQGKYAGMHVKNPPGQWGSTMYPKPGKPENLQNGAYLLHRKWYGDPKEFGYKDLIPLMSAEKFDPEGMVKLLDEAGVKYIAPMAVHHDGFAMWDSKVIDTFNAAKMGPKKDTTRLVIDAARKRGMKVGVSTHVMRHSWYYPKLEGYDTTDPRYVQLYGEGIEKGGLPKPAAIKKWEDTLKELIDTFHPDYIFSDGDTADIFCSTGSYVCTEAFRRIVAYYYNSAQAWGGEPVITFKRESLYKEEAVPSGCFPVAWARRNRPGRTRQGQSVAGPPAFGAGLNAIGNANPVMLVGTGVGARVFPGFSAGSNRERRREFRGRLGEGSQNLNGRLRAAFPLVRHALPNARPTGSVKSLHAPAGFEVDMVWENGRPTRAKIRSIVGAQCTLRYETKEIPLTMERGDRVSIGGTLNRL